MLTLNGTKGQAKHTHVRAGMCVSVCVLALATLSKHLTLKKNNNSRCSRISRANDKSLGKRIKTQF